MNRNPYYADQEVTLYLGDSLDILPTLADASVDAVVCDPPYGLAELATATVLQAVAAWMAGDRTHVPDGRGFMARDWDRFVPPPGIWDQCLRVLKPGGHLLAFAGSRTADLMGLSIRIAGFQIRDTITWNYGSGFPKSLNVAKAIESGGGRPEDIRRLQMGASYTPSGRGRINYDHGSGSAMGAEAQAWAATTPEAVSWQGWGTALKPASEPIIVARKPLTGTVAATVLQHGTGALNVDGCRTPAGQDHRDKCASVVGIASPRNGDTGGEPTGAREDSAHPAGRWPTNVLLTHQPLLDGDGQVVGDACADGCVPGCPVADMDRQSGVTRSSTSYTRTAMAESGIYGTGAGARAVGDQTTEYGDQGGASRFFPVFRYEAKAPASERPRLADGTAHPTVKPLALMQWLVRLVTPPGGLVLEPFAGSGTTLQAAVAEGMRVVGIEKHQPYADLTVARLAKPIALGLFGEAS